MSKASDNLVQSLRSSIARAVADQVERDLIVGFEELGYIETFESPIEQMLFFALTLNAVQRGRVAAFWPRLKSYRDYSCRLESPTGDVVARWSHFTASDLFETEVVSRGPIQATLIGPARPDDCAVRIFSQVDFKDYRLDFLVIDEYGARIAIECDGHDYHERTKEQAKRDRRRDRALTKDGLAFFRFTGSEIFADAPGCAAEVFHYLEEAFLRDGPRVPGET